MAGPSSSEQIVAATFLLPASSAEPLVIELPHHALRLVVVNNGSVGLLNESWDAGGIYVLLGPPKERGEERDRYSAYVGKAPSGLRSRVGHHVRSKEGWDRALLVAHTTKYGFSSAAIAWLEGRLWEVLNSAPAAELLNQVRPGDESLPPWERAELKRYITPVTAVLRALGANPDTPDQAPPGPRARRPRRIYSETVSDLLEAGLLSVGARLRPISDTFDTPATVLDDGTLKVGDDVFDTPSAAAVKVLGRNVNGWDWWGAASGDGTLVALSELRRRLQADGGKPAPGSPVAESGPAEPPGPTPDAEVTADNPSRPPVPVESDTEAEDADDRRAARRSPRRIEGTLDDLARAGMLEEAIFATFKGRRHDATRHGSNGLRLSDGSEFESVSLAASNITGRPTNGWTFWRTEHEGETVLLATLRALLGSQLD